MHRHLCHTMAVSSSLVRGSVSSDSPGNPLELGCRELMYPRRGDTHQRSQALWLLEELAARAGENDQPAIENDRLGSKLEREARMLLDEQHGQPVLALQPVEPGQQGIDDDRS